MSIEIGAVFRVNERNARYQIEFSSNSRKTIEELLELSNNLLYVVTSTNAGSSNYPFTAEIHPMFRHLVEDKVFYNRFRLDEMEIIEEDEQEPH